MIHLRLMLLHDPLHHLLTDHAGIPFEPTVLQHHYTILFRATLSTWYQQMTCQHEDLLSGLLASSRYPCSLATSASIMTSFSGTDTIGQ
jgi:hypothetical protein